MDALTSEFNGIQPNSLDAGTRLATDGHGLHVKHLFSLKAVLNSEASGGVCRYHLK
jgi:hypothetical protein